MEKTKWGLAHLTGIDQTETYKCQQHTLGRTNRYQLMPQLESHQGTQNLNDQKLKSDPSFWLMTQKRVSKGKLYFLSSWGIIESRRRPYRLSTPIPCTMPDQPVLEHPWLQPCLMTANERELPRQLIPMLSKFWLYFFSNIQPLASYLLFKPIIVSRILFCQLEQLPAYS